MKKLPYILLLVLLAITARVCYVLTHQSQTPSQPLGAISQKTTVTNSSSSITTAASLVLDANSGAQLRTIVNCGSNIVYLSFSATSTGFIAGTGIALYPAGGVYSAGEGASDFWTGKVWALTGTGTSSLCTAQL